MMPRRLPVSKSDAVFAALLVVIGAALAWAQYVTPYYGDDLNYLEGMYMYGHGMNLGGTLIHHWFELNGRLPNLLLAVALRCCPKAVVALLNAAVTVIFLWLSVTMAAARHRGLLRRLLLLAVIVFLFPWWDQPLMLAVSFNYVWAVTAVLLFIRMWCIQPTSVWGRVGAIVLAGASGMMHEGLSVAILAGFIAWIVLGRNVALTRTRLLMLVAFTAGSMEVVLSPAVISHALVNATTFEYPPAVLIALNCPLVILLLAVVAVAAVRRRHKLLRLCRSFWLVWAVAAVVGAVVVAKAGIAGRSGWFPMTFALIALGLWCRNYRSRIGNVLRTAICAVLVALICAHYAAFAYWQTRLGHNTRAVIEQYVASPDGVVYSDAVLDNSPRLLSLGKCVGVPDPFRSFDIYCFSRYYGSLDRMMLVLPSQLRDSAFGPEGWAILPTMPDAGDYNNPLFPLGRYYAGSLATPLPDGRYLISPLPILSH